jgi:hypothetical protein
MDPDPQVRYRAHRSVRVSILGCVLLVACGDNASPCDYFETNDVANADVAEDSAIAVGVEPRNLCGSINMGHFDKQFSTVDVDSFRVTVEGSGELLVDVTGDDGFQLFDDVEVRIFEAAVNPALVAAGHYAPAKIDHGAFIAELQPGSYDVVVSVTASGDLSTPIPYRVRISADPSANCPADTRAADFSEAHDGASSTDNDLVAVDFAKDPQLTLIAGTAEPSGIEIASGHDYRLSGNSAAVSHADAYLDRDTFAFTTDEVTNVVTVRLDWDGTTSDLDYFVFEPQTLIEIGASNLSSTTRHEIAAFAVKPATTYWLWVGRFKDTNGSATAYNATLCGSYFVH